MKEIQELAPNPESEQRKFYESLKTLSSGFQASLNELEKLSVFALMQRIVCVKKQSFVG